MYEQPSLLKILFAIFYDLLILLAIFMLVGLIAVAANNAVTGQDVIPASTISFQLLLYLVAFGYYAYFWKKSGQTVGMKAWRIRLINLNENKPLSLQQLAIRYVTAQLSFGLCLAGYLYRWVNPSRLTAHDQLSKTRIIKIEK